jgi:hypothetical protein
MSWVDDAYHGVGNFLWGKAPSQSQYIGPHNGQINDLINNGLTNVQGRGAPQLATGQSDQVRNAQMQQIAQMQGVASGQQQGAGELAVQRQAQNALAGQQAMAHMRGAGGAGMLGAQRNSANIGINAAGMGQQAALQDQQSMQGLLQNALAGTRGQDIGVANSNAQLTQNQSGMNDQQYMALLQSMQGMDQNQLQAYLAAKSLPSNAGAFGSILGIGGNLVGAYLGAKK